MSGVQIVMLLAKAFSSFFVFWKKERALDEAEKYLSEKFSLKIERGFWRGGTQLTSPQHHFNIYDQKWQDNFIKLVHCIIKAKSISLQTAEYCSDFILFVAVLSQRGTTAAFLGYNSPSYSYIQNMFQSKTYESMEHLARGLGSDVALEIVKKELIQWGKQSRII